jgi:hypothetical protein
MPGRAQLGDDRKNGIGMVGPEITEQGNKRRLGRAATLVFGSEGFEVRGF